MSSYSNVTIEEQLMLAACIPRLPNMTKVSRDVSSTLIQSQFNDRLYCLDAHSAYRLSVVASEIVFQRDEAELPRPPYGVAS